jgi:Glycosyltransferase Family 4
MHLHPLNMGLMSGAVIHGLQRIQESVQPSMTGQNSLKVTRSSVDPGRLQWPLPTPVRIDHAPATPPVLQGRDFQSRYVARRNRVLMVAPGLARGGAERQILATADGLLQRGYEVEIFYFTDVIGEPKFLNEFSQLGIACHHSSEFPNSVRGGDIEEFDCLGEFAELVDQLDIVAVGRALARAITQFRPHVVHCWSDLANVIGGLVGSHLGVPKLVLGQRNVLAFRYVDGVASYLCRDAYRRLAQNPNVLMINNSRAGLSRYIQWLDVPNHKIRLIYNGFLPRGLHVRGEVKRGSAVADCALPMIAARSARSCASHLRKIPTYGWKWPQLLPRPCLTRVLCLRGYGSLAKQVEQQIESLGLTQRFILAGSVKTLARFTPPWTFWC